MPEDIGKQLANILRKVDQSPELATELAGALSHYEDSSSGQYTKAEASYTDSGPEPFTCGNCLYFKSPNLCSIVSGTISPSGACKYFKGQEQQGEGVYSADPYEGKGRGTRLTPVRLPWRFDRWGWQEPERVDNAK